MEQKSENIFQVSIGNLPPRKKVTIEITYVVELEFKDGSVSCSSHYFLLLSAIQLLFESPNNESHKSTFKKSNNIRFSLVANLNMSSDIKSVSSSSHPVCEFLLFLVDAY